MALFTESRLRSRVSNEVQKAGFSGTPRQKAERIINESRAFSAAARQYDIFLSHSSGDAELVAGLKLELNDLGYTVYVDWIDDPSVNRSQVTKETALLLQQRMRESKSLIYAFSENASTSKWMPWELGYFDGLKKTVAVLPISKSSAGSFSGSEYLGIYNYIQIDASNMSTRPMLWVHETSTKYASFDNWLTGSQPTQH